MGQGKRTINRATCEDRRPHRQNAGTDVRGARGPEFHRPERLRGPIDEDRSVFS
jgi:hypothetical protein